MMQGASEDGSERSGTGERQGRIRFRTKLLAILATSTLAFAVSIAVSTALEAHAGRQLTLISERHIPQLALGPQLKADFGRLRQALQDAVAAQDREALDETRALRDQLLETIAHNENILTGARARSLREALERYYREAYDVSARLIEGQTGEAVIEAIASMQSSQREAAERLERATTFDQRQLRGAFEAASSAHATATRARLIVAACCLAVMLLLFFWVSRGVLRSLSEVSEGVGRFGKGDFTQPIAVTSRDEFADLARRANQMSENLLRLGKERDRADWLREGHTGLALELRGALEPSAAASQAARFLARYLDAPAAAIYWRDGQDEFHLLGHYATWPAGPEAPPMSRFRAGEGLIGQSASESEITIVRNLPADFFAIRSGLGAARPEALVLLPLVHLDEVTGVLELAIFAPWTDAHTELLLAVRETLSVCLEAAQQRSDLRALLLETQEQARRLAAQEDALRAKNDELEAQQEELRAVNGELTQQTATLEAQRHSLERNNRELLETRKSLERKARELTAASAYKSRFLANMSHELRTPLNSMLLLSNLLAENREGNLSEKQIEYAQTVHGAGKDLLALINQVLDLAKVEAGKQEIRPGTVTLRELASYAQRVFEPLAREKQLVFSTYVDPTLAQTIETDGKRVEQILNNLLGNAIKFTATGAVSLRIVPAAPELARGVGSVALAVYDTGVGIPEEHRERIFAPFEQLDAAPDRRYGGTGLGLSIARELAALLHGALHLTSTPGEGSTFTLVLPAVLPTEGDAASRPRAPVVSVDSASAEEVREAATRVLQLLMVEDDPELGDTLVEQLGREGIAASRVASGAAALAQLADGKFDCLIMDLGLPDMNGFDLLRQIEQLRGRDMPPVLVFTGRALSRSEVQWLETYAETVVVKEGAATERLLDEVRRFARRLVEGLPTRRKRPALATRESSVRLDNRKILIADDDMRTVYALSSLLQAGGAEVLVADTGAAALDVLSERPDVDLVLMDIMMPEMDGFEAMRRIREDERFRALPVVALTAKAMRVDREECLRAGANDYLQKPIEAESLMAMVQARLATGSAP